MQSKYPARKDANFLNTLTDESLKVMECQYTNSAYYIENIENNLSNSQIKQIQIFYK